MDGGQPKRVLVVEDDRVTATLLFEILRAEGFDPLIADELLTAESVARARPHLVLLDYVLGQSRAADLVRSLRRRGLGYIPLVLVSGVSDVEDRAQALGATAFLRKPFDIDALVTTCRSVAQ